MARLYKGCEAVYRIPLDIDEEGLETLSMCFYTDGDYSFVKRFEDDEVEVGSGFIKTHILSYDTTFLNEGALMCKIEYHRITEEFPDGYDFVAEIQTPFFLKEPSGGEYFNEYATKEELQSAEDRLDGEIASAWTEIDIKANADDVYDKNSVNTLLAEKADTANTYSKTETYSSGEIDTKLQQKANAGNVYSRTYLDEKFEETNAKIDNFSNLQEVTYEELLKLKLGNKLIEGRYYRITDYQCTTSDVRTKSANNRFDVIVLATGCNSISEKGYARKHYNNYIVANGIKFNFKTFRDNAYKSTYKVFLPYVWEDANGNVAYTEKKVNEATIDYAYISGSSQYVITETGKEYPSNDYFQKNNLDAWELSYSIENDIDRFTWADSSVTQERIIGFSLANGDLYIRNFDEDKYVSSTAYFAFNVGDETYYLKRYVPNSTETQYTYNASRKTMTASGSISISDRLYIPVGRGVIYYLKDEFNNICYYDFKNILFERYNINIRFKNYNSGTTYSYYWGIINDGTLYPTNTGNWEVSLNGTSKKYYYTFAGSSNEQDYSLNHTKHSSGNYYCLCSNNKIKPYTIEAYNTPDKEIPYQILNNIVLNGRYYNSSVMNNDIDYNNYDCTYQSSFDNNKVGTNVYNQCAAGRISKCIFEGNSNGNINLAQQTNDYIGKFCHNNLWTYLVDYNRYYYSSNNTYNDRVSNNIFNYSNHSIFDGAGNNYIIKSLNMHFNNLDNSTIDASGSDNAEGDDEQIYSLSNTNFKDYSIDIDWNTTEPYLDDDENVYGWCGKGYMFGKLQGTRNYTIMANLCYYDEDDGSIICEKTETTSVSGDCSLSPIEYEFDIQTEEFQSDYYMLNIIITTDLLDRNFETFQFRRTFLLEY